MMAKFLQLLLLLLPTAMMGCNGTAFLDNDNNCGPSSFYGTSGTITSPNYPDNYGNGEDCSTMIDAASPSVIRLTFEFFEVEYESPSCSYDYVQVSCSNLNSSLPIRYCGLVPPAPMTFAPCTQVIFKFHSDLSVTFTGFSLYYQIESIQCVDTCNPIISSTGYRCPCDTNRTITLPVPGINCSTGCYNNDNIYCVCPLRALTSMWSPGLPPATTTCPPGCNSPYCGCFLMTTVSPLRCAFGCYVTYNYWGEQYCNCPLPTTTASIVCSFGCFREVNIFGIQYCNCPPATTTTSYCFSPCYWVTNTNEPVWSDLYRTCYCPPLASSSVCGETYSGLYGVVTSPYYPNTYSLYTSRGINCYQYITVSAAIYSMQLSFTDLNIYSDTNPFETDCLYEYDYLQITGCDGSVHEICRLDSVPALGLNFDCTNTRTTTILFHSSSGSYLINNDESYRGYKLTYTVNTLTNYYDCSQSSVYLDSETPTGFLTSPYYPDDYPLGSECTTYLYGDDSVIQIQIVFEEWVGLDNYPITPCAEAFLQFTCQGGSGYSQTVCLYESPPPLLSLSCSSLQITFQSSFVYQSSPRYYKLEYSASFRNFPDLADNNNYLSRGAKLGIGLGVGIGGFFLLVVIVVLVSSRRRRSDDRERRNFNDVPVIMSNMNTAGIGIGGQDGGVRVWRQAPGLSQIGNINTSAEGDVAIATGSSNPPSYSSGLVGERGAATQPTNAETILHGDGSKASQA